MLACFSQLYCTDKLIDFFSICKCEKGKRTDTEVNHIVTENMTKFRWKMRWRLDSKPFLLANLDCRAWLFFWTLVCEDMYPKHSSMVLLLKWGNLNLAVFVCIELLSIRKYICWLQVSFYAQWHFVWFIHVTLNFFPLFLDPFFHPFTCYIGMHIVSEIYSWLSRFYVCISQIVLSVWVLILFDFEWGCTPMEWSTQFQSSLYTNTGITNLI